MKYNVGDTVDYKDSFDTFESCTVLGHSNIHRFYIVQIPKKYNKGWTSDSFYKKNYNIKVGTKRCWFADESELSPSKSNKGWNNPRGKNGRFTKKSNTKSPTLEERVTKIERELTNIVEVLGGNV